jgi:ubiquinone/menaquinone biosynthesis C-methylase UbiE
MTSATETAASANSAASTAPDFAAIKSKQRATWASGDYGFIGTTLQIVGESLCEAVDLRAGANVLDVAAGNGNVSLAAARRWADVTSTDYVASLLDMGRRRAEADRLAIRFQEADAEALPFPDASFDVVLSSFGVMFTPDHRRSASEMLRVCRPGGRIGLANWTPSGFIGKLFGVIGRYAPPPAGVTPAARWGTLEHLQDLFSTGATDIRVTPKHFMFRYRSPQHFVEVFRTWYGPVHKAFASLDEYRQAQLEQDIVALVNEFNTSGDETMIVPGEYLEVVVDRK